MRIKINYYFLKCIFLVITFIILFFSGGNHGVSAAPDDIVNIPDVSLKAALNSQMGQPSNNDITEAQMATLTYFSLNNSPATDLTGIEYAINLSYISIYNSQFQDLSLLKTLSKLESLTISGDKLTSNNFPDLRQSTLLKRLDLDGTNTDNSILEKVNKITSLEALSFESNMNITTIEPLIELPNLKDLRVQFCGISDFRPINQMPKLSSLAAFGQNTGRLDPETPMDRSMLLYDETLETLYLPFSIMPNVLTNFDGMKAPFTTSTSLSNTNVSFNNQILPESRVSINETGITINNVTLEAFKGLNSIEYNARYNFPFGSYQVPENYSFYAVSSGTYLHTFALFDRPKINGVGPVYYWQNEEINEETFLRDIQASVSDGSEIFSNFRTQVDFAVSDSYRVTLNTNNSNGINADPVDVEVIIKALPTLTCKGELTYSQYNQVSDETFYKDSEAKTEARNILKTDFGTAVNFNLPGTYATIITAYNEEGVKGFSKTVQVHIVPYQTTNQDDRSDGKEADLKGNLLILPATGQTSIVLLAELSTMLGLVLLGVFKLKKIDRK